MRTAPVCTSCSLTMIRTVIGANVITMYHSPPEPYKIWHTDVYKCPGCDNKVTAGYGEPTNVHERKFDLYLREIFDTLNKAYGTHRNDIIVEYATIAHLIEIGSKTRSLTYLLELLRKRFEE